MRDEQILQTIEILEKSGVATTRKNIRSDLGADLSVLSVQLARIVKNGWAYVVRGNYFVTTDGLDLIDLAVENPYPTDDWGKWAYEVLTGMDESGRETEIVCPALPRSGSDFRNRTEDKFISQIIDADHVREIIQNHPWLPVDKLADYWRNGLLVHCARCDKMSAHKKSYGSKSGLSRVCINCQREGK